VDHALEVALKANLAGYADEIAAITDQTTLKKARLVLTKEKKARLADVAREMRGFSERLAG